MVMRLTTTEASERLSEGYIYLDVRTPAEYAAGHPVGAVNVPVQLKTSGRMTENPDFVAHVKKRFSTSAKLVLGCASGRRSLVAAALLIDAGYTELLEMRAGYSGQKDAFGQIKEKGWAAAGLPTELETPGGSYDDIRNAP